VFFLIFQKNLKSLCQLLKWNKIKPNIVKRVSLAEVATAQTKLESGELSGIVVCLPWKKIETAQIKK
jgi:D-arabinose 1-dehydrogenase-like Zn-dependent alcohol dehydrogenase